MAVARRQASAVGLVVAKDTGNRAERAGVLGVLRIRFYVSPPSSGVMNSRSNPFRGGKDESR